MLLVRQGELKQMRDDLEQMSGGDQ